MPHVANLKGKNSKAPFANRKKMGKGVKMPMRFGGKSNLALKLFFFWVQSCF